MKTWCFIRVRVINKNRNLYDISDYARDVSGLLASFLTKLSKKDRIVFYESKRQSCFNNDEKFIINILRQAFPLFRKGSLLCYGYLF